MGSAAFGPQIEEIGTQRFGRQHIQRREGLVHQQDIGMHDQRAREADTLAHAARQLPWVGRLEAVETDQVDGGQRALADIGLGHALGFQSERDVLEHGQPGEQCEALEHHGDAGRGAGDRVAAKGKRAGAGLCESRDQTQQRGFAGAGTAEQSHDLPGLQGQIDAVEHQQVTAVRLLESLADILDRQQRLCFGGLHDGVHVSLNLRSA